MNKIIVEKNNSQEIISLFEKVEPQLMKRIETAVYFVIIDMKNKYKREGYVDKEKYHTIKEWSNVLGFQNQIKKNVGNVIDTVLQKGNSFQDRKAMYRLWRIDNETYDLGDLDYEDYLNALLPVANKLYSEKVSE